MQRQEYNLLIESLPHIPGWVTALDREGDKMRHCVILIGIISILLVACGGTIPEVPPTHIATTLPTATPFKLGSPTPTRTVEEQAFIPTLESYYGTKFYPSRSDCIQAVDNGTKDICVFPVGTERITKPEWEQLLPDTVFYIVDIGSWRSLEVIYPPERQDGHITRHLAAWQNGQIYRIGSFDRLLEDNAITINDSNRELVARSFALMSIPEYLGRDVRFLEWKPVEPGAYRYNYSHALKAWTEIWGCEVFWWFVFTDGQITVVSRNSSSCQIDEHGHYIENGKYFDFADEGVPLGFPPEFKDYYFNR